MDNIVVYGANISLPTAPEDIYVYGCGLPPSDQYWIRHEMPSYFSVVEYDRDGSVILTKEQEAYAAEEVRRCRDGYWFFNNGIKTYITGKNYFYLQWWKLEDDIYPNYRDADRRWFLFLDHWEKNPACLGVIRGKHRRAGATSQATSNVIYECVFYKNTVCGIVSKTSIDAKKAFVNMVSFGYRQLPVFLKPKQLNNKDSVTELVFANKSSTVKDGKGAVIDNDTGHRSSVDYRAPGLNSYDSGRLSRLIADEGGKWQPEVPFSTFISIVSKTMVKGARKVGFMELPSTVNQLTKSGGAEYKKVWDLANQFKYDRTPNRIVKYFNPAYDGYEGFIDKHGMSVIDVPTEEQYKYLVDTYVGVADLTEDDIRAGAKKYLEGKRLPLSGSDLEEEIRQNPFTEEEMFMYAGIGCEFNSANLQKQIQILEERPPLLRKMRLTLETKTTKSPIPGSKTRTTRKVVPMDDEMGGWEILELPEVLNNFEDRGGHIFPKNRALYQIGVDTVKDEFAITGSTPTIVIMKKSRIVEGVETGMYPVAMWRIKTRLKFHFDEQVKLACMLYGCTANYEVDAGTEFYRYFCNQKCRKLLEWTPKYARDPAKENFKPRPGTLSGDPFQLAAQLQVAKMYFDGTNPDVYNGHTHRIAFPSLLKQALKYDHSERTAFDEMIALMMALLPMMDAIQEPAPPQRTRVPLLPRYKIVVPAA